MSILLIDTDSTIPNLALMKISTYCKNLGYNVSLKKLNLNYYPNRKNKVTDIDTSHYEYIYCSSVFNDNSKYVIGENIEHGGTGYDYTKQLPEYVESCEPDYSLYPQNDISYGFISRGCIRKCSFCQVWKKEGYIKQVSSIKDIIKHNKVKFLDNNFLALPNHLELLNELGSYKNVKMQFNQGLDIRLVTKENSILLSNLNYLGEYIFAFDNISYESVILSALELMKWRKDWQFKFFVYVNPEMSLYDTVYRINRLKELKCLPYLMRDSLCWGSMYEEFYTDLAAWCNQVHCFKKMTFYEFLKRRHTNNTRIMQSSRLYKNNS